MCNSWSVLSAYQVLLELCPQISQPRPRLLQVFQILWISSTFLIWSLPQRAMLWSLLDGKWSMATLLVLISYFLSPPQEHVRNSGPPPCHPAKAVLKRWEQPQALSLPQHAQSFLLCYGQSMLACRFPVEWK